MDKDRSIKEHPEARLARLASQAVDAYIQALRTDDPETQALGLQAIAACLAYIQAPQTPKSGRLFWGIQARSIALKLDETRKTV